MSVPPPTNSLPPGFPPGNVFLEIIEAAPVAMLVSDRNGVIALGNAEARRILGYTETELRRLSVAALLPEKYWGALQAFLARFWLSPKNQPVEGGPEFPMCRKDGGEIWVQLGFSPVTIEGTVFALGVLLDISARKQAESARAESERTIRAILDHSFEFIGLLDTGGRMLRANSTSLQQAGVRWEDVKGRLFWETPWWSHSPGEQNKLRDAVKRAAAGEFVRYETTHPGPDGRMLEIDFSLKPVREEDGRITGLIPEGRDITERRSMEKALRDSEEKFSKVFRSSPDAISVSDLTTGQFLDVNEGYEKLSGYKRAELIGRTAAEMKFWSDPADREKMLGELAQHGSIREMQVKARTRSGELKSFFLSAEKVEIGGRSCVVVVSRDITARLRFEQALRESEEKFSKAFRASPHSLTISELATGRYLDVNRGFETISGYARAEALGRTSTELGLWQNMADREEMVRLLKTDGFVHNQEFIFQRRDRSLVTTLCNCELIEIGGVPCLLNTIEDITERRKFEQALRESEERFSKAFAASPDAIAITDLESGRYIEANAGHDRIYGFTREEVIGRTVLELGCYDNPEDRERVVETIRKSGSVRNLELTCRTKRREKITVLYSGEAIEMNGRKCIVSVIHDITGRKLAEEALRDSEARFRSYFESPFIGMAITSADRRWLEVNDHVCRMLGYPREELLALRWNDITVPEDIAKNEALLSQVMAGELDGCTFEKRYYRKDGSVLYANISTRSFRRGDGSLDYFLTVIQDVSGKHVAEEARARLEEQLRQAQKLEALGTLAGGIAHDFNNILSAMIVYRELAVMDIDRPDELRQHLTEIGLASNRAKDLVRQILTFSRQQQQERSAVQLHPVVREALQLLRASLPATIEIVPVIDAQAPQVLADTSQIHQIIMNLGTNAAHAMRSQPGRLKVILCRQRVDEALARLHPGLRPGIYVRLSIIDTGHGMDAGTVARIFEPFFTTKGPGEGTGLGLSVVHGIMEDHDGVITVNSRPGEGTSFDLYFPEYIGVANGIIAQEAGVPRGAGESVLLVDDEAALCEAMRTTLEKVGYRVTAFTNPVDAVSRYCSSPGEFDLVVTDHTMPRMTGLDVVQEVHRFRPELPVLLVSGLSGTWTPEKLRGFKISEVVAKPLDFAGLARAVRRALDLRCNSST